MKLHELVSKIDNTKTRSAWSKGVKAYAFNIIMNMIENNSPDYDFVGSPYDEKTALNGAQDWNQYSEGGCSLIYDSDIAERVCSPSEYKKIREGQRNPNSRENWIDCQSRALYQAYRLILRTIGK